MTPIEGSVGVFSCGPLVDYQGELPDAGEGMCCDGAAYSGPNACTCWVEVYDLPQSSLNRDAVPNIRPKQCDDCAYRVDSPERRGQAHVTADQAELDWLVETATPFWCHQGIRRVVTLLHEPSGYRHEVPEEFAVAYRPPIVEHTDGKGRRTGRPYKADGSPADYCHGWMARVLASSKVGQP